MYTLRLPGESNEQFAARAKRAARIAKILVNACFANRCMLEYSANPELPCTEADLRISPTVRVEYEQAIAIGDLGSCLAATRSKRWGAGPWIMPIEPDDVFFPDRVTHIYCGNSLYNRRFEQRQRLKELLGKRWRPLVEAAKRQTKEIFLQHLRKDQADAIRRILNIHPGQFWRACGGKIFLTLPPRMVQQELDFPDDE